MKLLLLFSMLLFFGCFNDPGAPVSGGVAQSSGDTSSGQSSESQSSESSENQSSEQAESDSSYEPIESSEEQSPDSEPVIDGPPITGTITASKASVNGYHLYIQDRIDDAWVNKRDYIIKGVCWAPVDKGSSNQNTNYSGRVDEDAALMETANINTVRLYGHLPPNKSGNSVLDKLFDHGIRVIMVVTWGGLSADDYRKTIEYFKNHPGILAWQVGNEFNYNAFYFFNNDFNTAMDYAKGMLEVAADADPNHPTILGWGHPTSNDYENNFPKLPFDILAGQVYTGDSFNDIFKDHKSRSDKPFFISEYGADSYNHNNNGEDYGAQAYAVTKLTKEIRDNLSANNSNTATTIGGTLFSWNDEWWKAGDWDKQDSEGTVLGGAGPYPDNTFDEDYWGIVTINRSKKDAFDALKEVYDSY